MTNPDRDDCEGLVKLADEAARWKVSDIKNPDDVRAFATDVESALRRLASSDGGVKVRELEWQQSHASPWRDDWHTTGPFTYTIRCADENGWKWSSGYGYGWCSTPDAAKAAAQANYEARIRSALVEVPAVKGGPEPVASERISQLAADLVVSGWTAGDHGIELAKSRAERKLLEFACDEIERHMRSHTAPPADAGMREALDSEERYLLAHFNSDADIMPGDIEGAFHRLREALTAPGATTKSDGGVEGHAEFVSGGKSRASEATDHRESCTEALGDPEALCSNSPERTGAGIKPGPSDLYLSRDAVRQILIEQPDENLEITEGVLADIDDLPIFTQADICLPSDPSSTRSENQVMTDDQIKHMVDRFLMWKLPEHFSPDCGISFDQSYRSEHGPVGTSLFDAVQATAMVRHMLEGLPSTRSDVTVEECERVVVAWADCEELELTIRQIHALASALLDQFEIRRK